MDIWRNLPSGLYRSSATKHIEYIAIDARHNGNITANIVLDKAYKEINASLEIYHIKTQEKVGEVLSGKISDKTITFSGHIANVQPWSAEHPNLYEARISVRDKKGIFHMAEEKSVFGRWRLKNGMVYTSMENELCSRE